MHHIHGGDTCHSGMLCMCSQRKLRAGRGLAGHGSHTLVCICICICRTTGEAMGPVAHTSSCYFMLIHAGIAQHADQCWCVRYSYSTSMAIEL
jgi:hypothetical protein